MTDNYIKFEKQINSKGLVINNYMIGTPVNRQSKSVEKFIWQSAAPDGIKRAESTMRACADPQRYSGYKKSKKARSFLLKRTESSAARSLEKTLGESSLFYSIKYLGVTKGLIGILSKRSRIPQLSPLETCKNVPLARINSSMSSKKPKIIIQNHELTESAVNIQTFKEEISPSEPLLSPEINEEFVVHTYARPKRLVATQKSAQRAFDTKNIAVQCKRSRSGLVGWKLIRPKTTTSEKQRPDQRLRKKSKDALQIDCKHIKIHTGYSEPYLRYLEEKKKMRKKGSLKNHS